jgi:uncharacterized RDD family membrane protein YckC
MADNAVERSNKRELIVEFAPEELRAPFALRCGALLIDYILVVAVPVIGLLFDLAIGDAPARALSGTTWLIAILVGISNIVLFPALSGQTVGMMICGLKIVRPDGLDPSTGRIILRNTVGYLVTLLTFGIGFLIAAVTPRSRALHDYIAGTIVVYGRKRRM